MEIEIEKGLKDMLPFVCLHCLEAEVKVESPNESFWETEVEKYILKIKTTLAVDEISQIPTNKSTRDTYKILGKDPSRYRPSAEALLRRVLKSKGLYKVNNVVDIINFMSTTSGFSIGGFDMAKINGDIRMDVGNEQPYLAIGRGELNIENMPALKDATGFFGTPTSDSERTMVTQKTNRFLMVFYDFTGKDLFENTKKQAEALLKRYAHASNIVGYDIK